MNKLKKSIQFAFPGSENAKLLGFEAEGCYYIEYTRYSTSPCQLLRSRRRSQTLQPKPLPTRNLMSKQNKLFSDRTETAVFIGCVTGSLLLITLVIADILVRSCS